MHRTGPWRMMFFQQSAGNPTAAANDFSPQRRMFYLLMSVFCPSFVSKGSRKGLV